MDAESLPKVVLYTVAMCGLVGAFRVPVDGPQREGMVCALRHRGPDAQTQGVCGDAWHGHTRLSIQDTSDAASQPFVYGDGMLSYNGELWNADPLREELRSLGHSFGSTGDTAVVAASLSEWGQKALTKLYGMFCLVWTSPREQIAVRDKYGKLPLYVCKVGDGFLWASERKALLGRRGAAVALEPGHLLHLGRGTIQRWDHIHRLRDARAGRLEEQLLRAVQDRLVSDVPLCTLLSGGVDSSLVTAMLARMRPDITAYTVYVWPDSPDLEAARVAASHIGVELREVRAPVPDERAIADAIRCIEVPNKTIIEEATMLMPLARQIAADGFRVVLSGDGADELFGGYGRLAMTASRGDEHWRNSRIEAFTRMSRGDFQGVNKAFMSAGVEVRMPFCARDIVETALSLGTRDCPPNKKSVREVASRYLPQDIAKREKIAFQTGAGRGKGGLTDYLEERYRGQQRQHYAGIVRHEFGRLVRG